MPVLTFKSTPEDDRIVDEEKVERFTIRMQRCIDSGNLADEVEPMVKDILDNVKYRKGFTPKQLWVLETLETELEKIWNPFDD